MNIANQFPEIDILLANDGFITVLKQLPVPIILPVEIPGIPRQ